VSPINLLLAASLAANAALLLNSVRGRTFENGTRRTRQPEAQTVWKLEKIEAPDLPPRLSRDAVLAGLTVGVVAVDDRGRTLVFNSAAEQLLGLEQQTLAGRSLSDFIATRLLHNLAKQVLHSGEPASVEIIVSGEKERILEATGTIFNDSNYGPGVALVLNDVTHLRQLETLRRDFVANVSHELKTPVASIQGFTETLLDGAMEDESVRTHFLEIILHQGKRLKTIIDDLLKLACLESSNHQMELLKAVTRAADLLENVRAISSDRAKLKAMKVTVDCMYDLQLLVNPSLIEQALLNLIDNAIKYCPSGAQVALSAKRIDGGAILTVRDSGPGIAQEHLARLFERFYRVDKGRSRDEGGSGLGLAIVKHIALAHGGNVSVESTLGAGSTFTIFLPFESVLESAELSKKAI
jgi:two-component system phosphate regulon sensor histidine kinase PhoR